MSEAAKDERTDGIDPRMSVNQVVDRFPRTLGVFDRHGIDSCCGGAVSLAAAAERDGVEVRQLLSDLRTEVEKEA